jgi:Txe/YoeB family toxin of Txe-Axe toxin-antitoxin module
MTPAGNGMTSGEQAMAQAKQLVKQYAQDPFRLSGAIEQLKSSYLAEEHHIVTKPAED